LARTLWYRQVALDYRHDLPVLTVLVLLCRETNSPSLTGVYQRGMPDGWPTNWFIITWCGSGRRIPSLI
jgi:hypothetical protein